MADAPCPDHDTLGAFVERTLPPEEVDRVTSHIDHCDACGATVAAVVRGLRTTAAPPTPAPVAPGTRLGRYQLRTLIGSGGIGQVYEALDTELERAVALKVLRPDLAGAASLAERLIRESRLMAKVAHPRVITIHDVGHEGDIVFIAMELVRGESLGAYLARSRRGWREVLSLFEQAGQGLAAAHAAGVIHRDFKPDNVLLGPSHEVVVTDFGLAQTTEPTSGAVAPAPSDVRLTATGAAVGTPAYTSPEQLDGKPADVRADVFAFCTSVWEGVFGERPFAGRTPAEIRDAMTRPPARSERAPRRLIRALARGLAVRPEERWPGMQPLLAELAAVRTRRRRYTRGALSGCAILLACALAVPAGRWLHARGATAGSPPLLDVPIAVESPKLDLPHYGLEPPGDWTFADTLARLLDQIGGVHLDAFTVGPGRYATPRDASFVARGAIREAGAELVADFDLVTKAGAVVVHVHRERPAAQCAMLLDDIAEGLARGIVPTATLARAPDRMRAELFFQLGTSYVQRGEFTAARPYLAQAADADPRMCAAWNELALALAWTGAPQRRIDRTIANAVATAPPGAMRSLLRGLAQFYAGDFDAARRTLAPLESASDPSLPTRGELLYYLGEVNWHDGRFDQGYAYFKRSLEDLSPGHATFEPSRVHAWEYELARRHGEAAKQYNDLGQTLVWLAFQRGDYTAVLRTPGSDLHLRIAANLMLGRSSAPDVVARLREPDLEASVYRVALALAAGDRAVADTELGRIWTRLPHEPSSEATYSALEELGELLIAADLPDATRQLVAELAQRSSPHPARGYERMSNLAAALLGDPSLVIARPHDERDARLGAAARAELAGNRDEAADILGTLIANPSFSWDYPERALRLRDLRALHRAEDAAALCRDTLLPAVFRPAFLVLRETCEAAGLSNSTGRSSGPRRRRAPTSPSSARVHPGGDRAVRGGAPLGRPVASPFGRATHRRRGVPAIGRAGRRDRIATAAETARPST